MQGGTIVRRTADTYIPNDYLEKVLAANPTCWGAAMIEGSELQLNSGTEGATLEFIQETMKAFADKDITFYFGHADAALNEADIPPYILITKDGDDDSTIPLIVGFYDGNFPSFDKGGSSHPPEYHLSVDYMIPKLEGLMEICDNDLDKVTAAMQKPYFKKELLLTSVSRGTITLVCANGVALTFAQTDQSAEFPWGWVSNTHGYVSASAAPPKEEGKKKPMFPSRSTVREPAPAPAKIAEAVAAPKTDATAIKNYTTKKERPPAHLSRRERGDWYKVRMGHKPRGWVDSIAIDVFYDPNGKMMSWSQVKGLGLLATGVMALANNPPPEKDTQPEQVQSKDTLPVTTDKKVTAEVLPIMSPMTKEHIGKLRKTPEYQKIIADNAELILDPAKVQALEAKFADFATQVGAKSIDEFIQWDYEQFLDLGKTRVDGLAVMCWTFRNIVAAHKAKAIKQEVKQETKQEVPAKKPMFPKRDAA